MKKDSSVAVIATIRIITTRTVLFKILNDDITCNFNHEATEINNAEVFKQAFLNHLRSGQSIAFKRRYLTI